MQDAILADPVRSQAVEVIDIRYWAYTADGGLYAPNGGENLAPRQHRRKTKLKPGGAAAIVRAVREYRQRFPDKAVAYYAEQNCPSVHDGWAILIGGGSLADVPRLPDGLTRVLPQMKPVEQQTLKPNQWMLARPEGDYLFYVDSLDAAIKVELPKSDKGYQLNWIDAVSGAITKGVVLDGGRVVSLQPKAKVVWISGIE